MAVRIPTYESRLTPSGQGIQARASAVNVSDAIGRGLQNLGQVGTNIAETINKDITEAKVREADNKVSEAIRGYLYNPESGYLTKVGKDAVDSKKDIETNLQGLKEKIGVGLETNDQRKMFDDIFNRRLESALNNVTSHAAQQAMVYNKGEAAARTEMAIQDAISNYADSQAFNTARATALQESVYGLSGSQAEVAARSALTKLHTGVISQMLAQDRPALAREWFANNSHEIDPTQHDAIIKSLQAGSLKEDSLNLSFQLQAKTSDYSAQQKLLKDQFQKGTISAEVYDATNTRLSAAYNERQVQLTKWNNSMEGQAQDYILKHPGMNILDLPNNLQTWARSQGKWDSLLTFSKSAGNPDSNNQMFTDLAVMATDNPIKFVEEFDSNNASWRSQVSASQYNSLLGFRTAISKNDIKGQQTLKVATNTIKFIAADLKAAGIDTTPKEGTAAADTYAAYNASLINAINEETTAKGHALTNDEARAVGLRLLQEGRLQDSGFFRDTRKRRYEVTSAEAAATPFVSVDYNNISAIYRTDIEAEIEQRRANGAISKNITKGTKEYQALVERIYQNAKDKGVIR